MLMKLAIWGSLSAADGWNRMTPARTTCRSRRRSGCRTPSSARPRSSSCTASHTPISARAVALLAALLLALDPNMTSINGSPKKNVRRVLFSAGRVAVRAGQAGRHATDVVRAQRWYMGSAARVRVMMASKYLPHLYGLYTLANLATLRDAGAEQPDQAALLPTMGGGVCDRELRDPPSLNVVAHAGLRAGRRPAASWLCPMRSSCGSRTCRSRRSVFRRRSM